MADEPKDEPKPKSNDASPASGGHEPTPASISPAPTDVTEDTKPGAGGKPGANPKPGAPDPNQKIQAEPLADGTTPTVLATGQVHRSVPKSKASLTTVYRRADIITTLLTFVGAIVAGGIILGGYAYLTRAKSAAPTATPKVTKLDKSDLDKLDAFFSGNSAGGSAQVLTISSSSLFKNRVAISSDLKVIGGLQVSGTTALADLTVDKTSTLGITNIRGSLTVAGPFNAQSPAILSAGATINGNLAATGNASFGGSISAGTLNVRDLTVTGNFNLSGHLNISGQNPSAAPASAFVSSASVSGTDAAGTVTITMPPVSSQAFGGLLVTVTFRAAYPRAPTVVITPSGRGSALFQPYILKTATNFTIGAATIPSNGNATSYSFDYWVAQ
jgi:hypothetical protein